MYNPRIAVSVDMIATGTDVKPLECLLFMRNVKSAGYFEQMKGRGVRVVDADTLQTVTRDATAKTHFVIVDAVGVCEQDKTDSQPLDREPTVPLAKVLEAVAKGVCNPDVASTLASRLARLDRQLTDAQRSELADLAGGRPMRSLAGDLLGTLDPDAQVRHAAEKFGLADGQEPSPQQVDQAGKDMIRAALKPFYNPALRDRLVEIRRATEQVIDEVTQDVLIQAGFDADAMEKAKAAVEGFRAFIAENKDRIEGIQVLYSRPYREGLRFRHVKELHAALSRPPISTDAQRLWRSYRIVEPSAVRGAGGKPLVDLIALVRHAIDPERPIEPFAATVEERYHAWLGGQAAAGVSFTPEQRRWLDAIKDHIATSVRIDQDDFDDAPFNQLGGLGRVHELFGDRLPAILNELNVRLAA